MVYDVQYHNSLNNFKFAENISICPPHPPDQSDVQVDCGRVWPVNMDENWTIVYVGQNDAFQTLLCFTYNKLRVIAYDPSKELFIEDITNIKRALMKRYMMVEKTKGGFEKYT